MRKTRVLAVIVGLVLIVGAGVLAPVLQKLDYAQIPTRASWQHPERVIDSLRIEPGAHLADIGAGDGYFTFYLADAVGPTGRVYAVDVDAEAVKALRAAVESKGYDNVEVIHSEAGDAGLPDGSIDLAFVCNVYHHIEDRVSYFRGLRRDLISGGRLAIVEVSGRAPMRWLSPPGHSTPLETMRAELAEAGYATSERFDFLPVQAFEIFARLP